MKTKTIRFKITTGPAKAPCRKYAGYVDTGLSAWHPSLSTDNTIECQGNSTSKSKKRRSRVGCAECKRRRVKCDETFPSVSATHSHFFDPSRLAKCLEERHLAIRLVQREIAELSQDIFPVFLTVLLLGLSTAWNEGPTAGFGLEHLRGARALIDITPADKSMQKEKPSECGFMIGSYLYWDMASAFLVPTSDQDSLNTSDIFLAVLNISSEYHPIGGYSTEIYYHTGNVGGYCRYFHDTGIRDPDLEDELERLLLSVQISCEDEALAAIAEAFRLHALISLAAICQRQDLYLFEDLSSLIDLSSIEVPLSTPPGLTSYPESPPLPSDIKFPSLESYELPSLEINLHEPKSFIHQSEEISRGHVEPPIMSLSSNPATETAETNDTDILDLEAKVPDRALRAIQLLASIPTTHVCTNLQAIPLMTAGSELTEAHTEERSFVRQRFQALYSLSHIRNNLTALSLLEESWALRDRGIRTTWLDLMLEKGWCISLG
ncbi:hypothetical protein S7711_01697 [Stachybotrys chartarum IBT 7711]|uniref:Zn(2)-C6 fungal-type domain-containing protein n=1 Tax=Stachybotrys chartarum (strain CBS 109288 / IBT 7711) TaxID=1280523 RepID=A0A084AVB3_STACB|nr:hypothetical protein S7711_01697 [Stachybotrys chartarum IBT 7711]